MLHTNFRVVLDSCVLANQSVCDLFLRLAETPRMYVPLWSDEILKEVQRTHIEKLNWPRELASTWQTEVRKHFPEALVRDYERFMPLMENDPKDRHVLAAAICGKGELVVTFNLRDFPTECCNPYGISVEHPSDYLITLCSIDIGLVVSRLRAIAHQRDIPIQRAIQTLSASVPRFTEFLTDEFGFDLSEAN